MGFVGGAVAARVYHAQIHARCLTQNIDTSAVVKKVLHHLPGNGLGKGRNPLIGHAVVARNCKHDGRADIDGRLTSADGVELLGKVFKAAKAALRLGEVVQMGLCSIQIFLKQGRDAQAGQDQFKVVGLGGIHAVCLSLTVRVRKAERPAPN